ncbi:hypothetical protein [Clostridium estertheticum]|uniref:Uncharacterized protein n=1 Tax=Clostridium estertheticum TaxID=238834 RepID=A0A7Y3SVZ2_9CLOT|nr:hypothetical protein [Clostridium estertheticum]NNU76358.1 hypothetical protein [Clostridium estertheticum]WBL45849.1 hypothetical protein LOR37_14295 [Clostridium estertheticum]
MTDNSETPVIRLSDGDNAVINKLGLSVITAELEKKSLGITRCDFSKCKEDKCGYTKNKEDKSSKDK